MSGKTASAVTGPGHGGEPAALAALLARALPPVVGVSTNCTITGPLHQRMNSRIYRADCPGLPDALAVKLCLDRSGQPSDQAAAEQFRSLSAVFATMDRPPFRVPRPYAVDAAAGVVITEWIDATPMTERLRTPLCTLAEAKRLAAAAGAWLQRFHGARVLPPASLDIDHKLGQLERLEGTAIASRRTVGEAIDALRRRAAAAAGVPVARSWLHGDFKSDNVLCEEGGVVGIDIHARRENVVLYDLAPFMNHLQVLACDPRSWRWAPRVAAVQAAFLAGYLPQDQIAPLPLLWLRIFLLLSVWEMVSGAWRGVSLKGRLGHYCFERSLRSLTAALRAQ